MLLYCCVSGNRDKDQKYLCIPFYSLILGSYPAVFMVYSSLHTQWSLRIGLSVPYKVRGLNLSQTYAGKYSLLCPTLYTFLKNTNLIMKSQFQTFNSNYLWNPHLLWELGFQYFNFCLTIESIACEPRFFFLGIKLRRMSCHI